MRFESVVKLLCASSYILASQPKRKTEKKRRMTVYYQLNYLVGTNSAKNMLQRFFTYSVVLSVAWFPGQKLMLFRGPWHGKLWKPLLQRMHPFINVRASWKALIVFNQFKMRMYLPITPKSNVCHCLAIYQGQEVTLNTSYDHRETP